MKTNIPTSPFQRRTPKERPKREPRLVDMSVCRVSRKRLPRCLPVVLALLLTSCALRVSDPATGRTMCSIPPSDSVLISYTGTDSQGRVHTLTATGYKVSPVIRANWKGIERTLGTVGPMLRPEAAVGTIVPLLGREGL